MRLMRRGKREELRYRAVIKSKAEGRLCSCSGIPDGGGSGLFEERRRKSANRFGVGSLNFVPPQSSSFILPHIQHYHHRSASRTDSGRAQTAHLIVVAQVLPSGHQFHR